VSQTVNLRNVFVLLGLVITTTALIFFAVEFQDVISEWGRVLALSELAVGFIALGVHLEHTMQESALTSKSGWGWLKVTNAFYILGAVGVFSAVIAFIALDDLDRLFKVLALLAVGIGLILVAARFMGGRSASDKNGPSN